MLEGTGVYVCTICGFVFLDDEPPAMCPVCKVPSWKFEKVEGVVCSKRLLNQAVGKSLRTHNLKSKKGA